VEVEEVDTETGEIITVARTYEVGHIKMDNIVTFAERIANYQRTESDVKHGGQRITCPKHPDAGTITSVTTTCRECGDLLSERVTYQAPDPRARIVPPSTGTDTSLAIIDATTGPDTQDGNIDSVTVYVPKMGIPEDPNLEMNMADEPKEVRDFDLRQRKVEDDFQ
jgi:hypothetical protein